MIDITPMPTLSSHTSSLSAHNMPLPKINVPPAHLLAATQEFLESSITAISSQTLPSQQTISAGRSFAPYTPEVRSLSFTLSIIGLIVAINIGLALLLSPTPINASNSITPNISDIQLTTPQTGTSESAPVSRKKILSDLLDKPASSQ